MELEAEEDYGDKPRGRVVSVSTTVDALKEEMTVTIYDMQEPKSETDHHEVVHPPLKPMMSSKNVLTEITQAREIALQTILPPKRRAFDKPVFEGPDKELYYCLEFFEASLFATILEDTITELQILTECNDELRIMKTLADMPLLIALKYQVTQPAVLDELDKIDPRKLNCNEYKLNKLVADRDIITATLSSSYFQLALEKCFQPLAAFSKSIIDREIYCDILMEDEEENKILRRDMAKNLRVQRNHHKTLILQAEFVISDLRSQIEDADLMTETKGRYIDNWQSARTEQHQQVIFEKESIFTNSMEYYKTRSDIEARVHSEIDNLTSIIISETLQKVEDWMDKYDTDMEQIDLKIQIQRNDYQQALDKRRDFERLYAKHTHQMEDWIQFKEDRAAAQKYNDDMHRCATIVQAWWRGLLVRRQLGPFRPKKEKKKAKPKKGLFG